MKKILLLTLLIVLIPTILIKVEDEDIINKIKYGIYSNKLVKLKDSKTGEIIKIPLEEYVLGVVAGEMPASFNEEALKAQAVASRTYVLKRMENNKEYDVTNTTNDQVYITKEQMQNKWKNDFKSNYNKIKKVVESTKGEVVLYDNKIIDALFFSTSNGYTENSGNVFSSDYPYLISVESKWDEKESPVFSSVNEISKKEFLYNLGLNINDDITIKDINKTNTGRIISMNINGKVIQSKTIRNAFNLRSTSFDINVKDDNVVFNVKGFGHGVGLSQYGSNGMAKQGFKYKEILEYYYKDSKVKKIN